MRGRLASAAAAAAAAAVPETGVRTLVGWIRPGHGAAARWRPAPSAAAPGGSASCRGVARGRSWGGSASAPLAAAAAAAAATALAAVSNAGTAPTAWTSAPPSAAHTKRRWMSTATSSTRCPSSCARHRPVRARERPTPASRHTRCPSANRYPPQWALRACACLCRSPCHSKTAPGPSETSLGEGPELRLSVLATCHSFFRHLCRLPEAQEDPGSLQLRTSFCADRLQAAHRD
mmetsp:Transcript_114640/g.331308  ORF Transcript_114640/g.331308 Transcript_114640/m.331308 type:complete len:233 (-) Transcript_114640:579-1277(-)